MRMWPGARSSVFRKDRCGDGRDTDGPRCVLCWDRQLGLMLVRTGRLRAATRDPPGCAKRAIALFDEASLCD